MFCTKCGQQLNDDAKFCSACGTSVESVEPQEAPKKKKTGLIVGLSALVLVLLVGGVVLFMVNRPINKIKNAFAEGNVEAAVSLYDEVTSEKDAEKVVEMALTYAVELKDAYIKEEENVDYDMVHNSLNALDTGITEGNAEIAEINDVVEQFKTSRDNFADAQSQEEKGNYVEALNLYSSVISEDGWYYEKAQAGITSVTNKIRQDAISEIDSLADAGEFDEAQSVLDDTLSILEGDSDLLAKQDELTQRIIDDYVSRAETAVAEGRYTDTFNIINAALEEYPDNASILAVKDTIPEEAYLIGTWAYDFNFAEILYGEGFDEFSVMEESAIVSLFFTFREDGTMIAYFDEESLSDSIYNLTLEYTYATLEAEGINRDDAAEIVQEAYGITIEEYVYMICESEVETIMEEFSISNDYRVEGNRLYTNDAEEYEVFTISGDTLTLDLPGEDAGMELIYGLSYPLVFRRVDVVLEAEGSI